MKIFAPFAALALLAAGCATVATPRRCEQAAAGLDRADQIAQLLNDFGIAPAKARKLAEAVTTGRMLLAAACAQVPAAAPVGM
jgi:hypothetical protein